MVLEINLSHNRVDSLPRKFVESFPRLKKLDLSFNEFRELPSNLEWASCLEELNIEGNKFWTLPTWTINLINNKLTKLYFEWSLYFEIAPIKNSAFRI